MAKKGSYFDLVEDILNEISKKADEVSAEIDLMENDRTVKDNCEIKNTNKVKSLNQNKKERETQEGKTIMIESMEGRGIDNSSESLEGRSMMTSSMEGVTQMNYSMEGSDDESLIYECNRDVVKKVKARELLKLNNDDDLKRGLILSEILGKPKSLRD